MPGRGDSAELRENQGSYSQAMEAIQRFPLPVIAMLYGYTLGAGCILAMGCDIRLASKNVKMGIPTSRMGLLVNQSVFKRFLTVLGYSTALEIFLTGQHYDGQECISMGLVNHLVDHGQLESYTYRLAEEIIQCAPLSLRGSKYILGTIAGNPTPSAEELETFRALSTQATSSDDHEEAKRAFKEKRKPRFSGH
jgi:enoyl-CoA hydratase/carnithine racemase